MNVEPFAPTSTSEAVCTGFKDWAVICDALGRGRQSLILRKGGIAEGRDGFRFKHEQFFLFPTGYHQQTEMVRPGELTHVSSLPATNASTVEIQYLFALEFAHWIDDYATVARLEPFHIWRDDVIRERFSHGDQRGLQCAFGRVYHCDSPWSFANRPAYGGCRSWVTLPPAPAALTLSPVLSDSEHDRRRQEIEEIVRLT